MLTKEQMIELARAEGLPALIGAMDHLASLAEHQKDKRLMIMAQNPADNYRWSDPIGEYTGTEIAAMAEYASTCLRMIYGLPRWELEQEPST